MIITTEVFHCSPVRITDFYIPENGLHFGSLESGIIAVSRKLTNQVPCTIYVHKVKLDVTRCQELFDIGFNWAEEVKYESGKIFKYKNKYEPSLFPSYVIFDTSLIISVEQVYPYLLNREVYDGYE